MDIRPFRDSDKNVVIALWNEVFPDNPPWNEPASNIQLKSSVQPELFFVAELGDEVAGTAMAGFDGHRGWVYFLAVAPTHRRKGIGRALMQHAENALAELGCTKTNLQVRPGNDRALSFYQQIGYGVEERISMGKRLIE